MPELPEVETVRRTLERQIQGKTISRIELYRPQNIATDPGEFIRLVTGKSVAMLGRKGKWLRFHLSGDLVILSHLRMEGKFYYYESKPEKGKHDIVRFDFSDGSCLVYNDTRKFGRLALSSMREYKNMPSYRDLGPEPWHIEPKEFLAKVAKRRIPAKEALLDQSIMCGLGNIYADETLYASHVHPLFPANKLNLEQATALVTNARKILDKSLLEGGSTVRTYHPGHGIDGRMQLRLRVYSRAFEPCLDCGHKLIKTEVGGRGTTFCPRCQHQKGLPYVLGITGPIHSGKSTAAAYFEAKGFHRFNADEVAKESYQNETIREKVIAVIGENAYKGTQPDFDYLRGRIAQDPKLKEEINAIIHPYVFKKAQQFIASFGEGESVLLDVPLLIDAGMEAICDDILLVDASIKAREKRIHALGQDRAKLLAINKGYPLNKTKKYASYVVKNNASVRNFNKKLDLVYKDISQGERR